MPRGKKQTKRVDMSRVSFTATQLKSAAKRSESYYDVAESLDLDRSGGNYETVKKYMRMNGLKLGR